MRGLLVTVAVGLLAFAGMLAYAAYVIDQAYLAH